MKLNVKIKVTDLKLSLLFVASLFILGQAFLTFAENKDNSSNLFLDSDHDGLSDQEERIYETDPNSVDSDRDGYTDGAEVKSGYDPLKPSPGDKLETVSNKKTPEIVSALGGKVNLTQKLNEKLSMEMGVGGDAETIPEEITTENLRSLVQDFLNETSTTGVYSTITVGNIQIKEQDYSGLSGEEATRLRAQDFTDYVVSVFYVLSLNSEKPILGTTDFERTLSEVLSESATALLENDINYFRNLSGKGQKVLREILEVEVPEEFKYTHAKMINIFGYGLSLIDLIIQRDASDPVASLINFSKINSFLDVFQEALAEFRAKSNQYELDNDYIKNELEKLGIDTSDS